MKAPIKGNFDKARNKKISQTFEDEKNSTSHQLRTRGTAKDEEAVKGDYPGLPSSSQIMTILQEYLTGKKVEDTNLELYKNFLQPSQVGKINDFFKDNYTSLGILGVVVAGIAVYMGYK